MFRLRTWLWIGGGAALLFLLWRFMRPEGSGYTAEDVASLGTVAPGANIFADTGGAIGYGIPSNPGATPNTTAAASYGTPEISRWLQDFSLLGSGPNSTAPGSSGPVLPAYDAVAMGYQSASRAATSSWAVADQWGNQSYGTAQDVGRWVSDPNNPGEFMWMNRT